MGFERVFIIGFGQMGKSIANTLRDGNFTGKIYAYSRSKIVDCDYIDDAFDIENPDINYNNSVVFICTPPDIVLEMIEKMLEKTSNTNCIISDVCSVKQHIFSNKNLQNNKNFISIHPMDGGNSTGKNHFFKKNILNYVINDNQFKNENLQSFLSFLEQFLKCKNVVIDSKTHDKIVAITSHIPNLILMSITEKLDKTNIKMWQEIFKTNQENILKSFEELTEILQQNNTKTIGENYENFLQQHRISIDKTLQNPSLKNILNINKCVENDNLIEKLKTNFEVLISSL